MLNWNIIPMTYNDSFTYMEWLGKLNYVAENHEERIDAAEKEIIDLWTKVNNHEERIGTLETWRTDVVDPFIEDMTVRVGVIEDWKENTVDPFITDITNWKDNTVDPFIEDIGPRVAAAEEDIDQLQEDLTVESAARKNADNVLTDKVDNAKMIAQDAYTKVNRIQIDLDNIGTIRYFIESTITSTQTSTDTIATIELPDEDWGVVDVRGHYGTTEFRITGARNSTQVVSGDYTYDYDDTTNTITLTISGLVTLDRLDYILYRAALTPSEQEQADIDFYNAMDTNGDGKVNAVDASQALAFYAYTSSHEIPGDLKNKEAWEWYANNIDTNLDPNAFPDYNQDGRVNAVDASNLLGYYAWLSTHDTTGLTGPEAMRLYRTQVESAEEEE